VQEPLEGLVKAAPWWGPEAQRLRFCRTKKCSRIYLEYGHALYQLGRSGQKFQFGNAITVFNHLKLVAEKDRAMGICTAMSLKALFEARGQRHHDRRAGPLDPRINHSTSIRQQPDPGPAGSSFATSPASGVAR